MTNKSMETVSGPSSRSTPTTSLTNTGSRPSSYGGQSVKEFNLNEDTSLSPVDLEALIQTERITKILDECIYKTKLAICLPNLVKEFHTLSSILSTQHMEDLVLIFDQYDKPLMSSSFVNMEALEEIKSGAVTLKHRLNPELGHLLHIMHAYPALKPKVEDMIKKMKVECKLQGTKLPSLDYLGTLERFRDLMVDQLSTLAADELAVKFKTKKLETQNAKLITDIKDNSEALAKEKEKFNNMMHSKTEKIRSLEEELSTIKTEATSNIQKKILQSEQQMVLVTREHNVKMEILQDEAAETTKVYNNMLATNLKTEKALRARRFKVEMQLLSWIKKYDQEMIDRQAELDDYQQKYDDEVHACQELEEKLKLQDVEYIPLMAEREEEYHREMTEKMQKFLLEHAARVIQSAWRNVLLNRAEKKKLHKLQSKKLKMELREKKQEKKREPKKHKQLKGK